MADGCGSVTGLVGASGEQDAMMALQLASETSPSAALTQFFSQQGIERGQNWRSSINGNPAASAWFRVANEQAPVTGLVAFVQYGDRVFALMAYCAEAKLGSYRSTFESSLGSLKRVTDRAAVNVQPRRLKVVRADRNEPLQGFARRHRSSAELAELELINQITSGGGVERGRSYKLIMGEVAR